MVRRTPGRVWIGSVLAFALGAANFELYHLPFALVAPWQGMMILSCIEAFVLALAVHDWDIVALAPLAMWAGYVAITISWGIANGYVSGPYYWGSTLEFATDMLVIQLAPALVGAAIGMALISGLIWRQT